MAGGFRETWGRLVVEYFSRLPTIMIIIWESLLSSFMKLPLAMSELSAHPAQRLEFAEHQRPSSRNRFSDGAVSVVVPDIPAMAEDSIFALAMPLLKASSSQTSPTPLNPSKLRP